MARTLKAYAPADMDQVTVVLINPDTDAIMQTVTMTQGANGKGIYKGTLAAAAGTYDAVLYSDNGTVHRGSFGYVRVLGVDPETAHVGDPHGVPDGVKLGRQIQRDNVSGDQLTETIAET